MELKTNYLHLEYNPNLKDRTRALRKARNLPEVLFWMQVNKIQFHGLDFDRQRIIGNYSVDFYCRALGLVVEIDGCSHKGKEGCDDAREEWLVAQGCIVVRFTSVKVLENMGGVLKELEEFVL